MKERTIRTLIRECGGVVVSMQQSRHWKVTAQFGDIELKLVFPSSGSDWRMHANQKAWIARQLRQANDNKKPLLREGRGRG